MTDIEDLALRIKALEDRVGARNATQIDSSSVDVGDDDSLVVSDVVADAADATAFNLPNLQDILDVNAERLQENAEAVQDAMDAADAAEAAGLAAGEEASQAADEALENAQAANAAAAAAQSRADDAKAAADAAGITAGSAAQAAQQAQAAADAAGTTANAAQATANGKNAVTYSTSNPSDTANPGTRAGDIWFVRNGNGWLSAQYEWDGSHWNIRNLDSAILAYIDAGKITAGTLDANRIGANSITATHLAADSVTSNAILAGTIQAVDIAAGTITGDRIAAATLTASLLMADTLTSREIGADAILARNIKAAEITGAKIAAATITGGNIAANTITAGNIKAGTLTANEIAANTITANEINLDTLNGKSITGVNITGGTLSTTPNSAGAYVQVTGGNITVRNTNNTAYNFINTFADGQMQINVQPTAGTASPTAYIKLNPNGVVGNSLATTPIALGGSVLVTGRLTHNEQWFTGGSSYVRWLRSDPTGSTSYPSLQVSNILNANGDSIMADTGWLTFPLASGATNADSARPARYRRIGNRLEMRGSIQMSNWGVIGNFNSSSRPTQDLIMAVATNGSNPARLRVATTGTVDVLNISSTAAYVSLDGLYFLLD